MPNDRTVGCIKITSYFTHKKTNYNKSSNTKNIEKYVFS